MTAHQETHAKVVLYWWNNGIRSARKIQQKTGLPRSTVYYNLSKIKKYGNVTHQKRKGRPLKITSECSLALGQYIRRNPSISSRSLAAKLSKKGIKVVHGTVCNHLKRVGYKKRRAKATPMLTSKHKMNRIKWAQEHINDDWSQTVFSDETCFQLFRNVVQYWYRGKRPLRRIPKNRQKICAWGAFWAKGKTNLFCFQRIMNGPFYVEILEKHIPGVNRVLGNSWRFQQDNDPKHQSKVAKKFLQENVPTKIDWPSNSPDLNPIENMWKIVKDNVEKRRPENLDELKRFMVEEWDKIPDSFLINLAKSMNERCKLIIEQNGERISY
jgi:transposase